MALSVRFAVGVIGRGCLTLIVSPPTLISDLAFERLWRMIGT